MTKLEQIPYGKAGYRKFKREFKKREWSKMKNIEGGLESENSKLHASMFIFDGKGMMIHNPISYSLCKLKQKRQYKRLERKESLNKVKW
ncbi:hypothetical protein [Priestia megaterium]|uniref:hypothetical protein n=1 Tax=Priestia megaterium TaxID=1404 RepID=UPI002877DC9B|nr:hypothetical protein [Priestia megaterium]